MVEQLEVTTQDVIAVAEFRSALRHFLRRSEKIARQSGLTPQRYTLLMMIKGAVDGHGAGRADAARAEHRDRARAPRRERGPDRARAVATGCARGPSAADPGGGPAADALLHGARCGAGATPRGVRQSRRRRDRALAPFQQVPAHGRVEDALVGGSERLGAGTAISLAGGQVEIGRQVTVLLLVAVADE